MPRRSVLRRHARAVLVLSCAVLSLAAPSASADTLYDWAISGPAASLGGVPFAGSGTLTVGDSPAPGTVPDGFLVTAITGTFAGSAVSAVLPTGTFFGNDNLIFPTGSSLIDTTGLAFETVSGVEAELYGFYAPNSTDVTPGNNYAEYVPGGGFGVGTFSLVKVPEPASVALLGFGVLALFGLRRHRA